MSAAEASPVRVMRIIARMNLGGPAHHVASLSGGMSAARFHTLLVTGRVADHEGSFEDLADLHGARVLRLSSLGPDLNALRDTVALFDLVRLMRRFRPAIVHTHTAKAGFLGRSAARIAMGSDATVIHTFHGHVLEDYFGPGKTALFRSTEKCLARATDLLLGVSEATVSDLVRLGIAPREKFRVVPVGLPLGSFLGLARDPESPLRRAMGLGPQDVLLLFVGRIVPIKRLDVLLEAMRQLLDMEGVTVKLAIAGGGSGRALAEAKSHELGLEDSVSFLGFRRDLEDLLKAADIAVLSSDNEGTPVSLIEAGAAGLPSVATNVGGVGDVVPQGTGLLVPRRRPTEFADAVKMLADDPEQRRRLGARARDHVQDRFAEARLIRDVEDLYERMVGDDRVPVRGYRRAAERVHEL